MHAIDALHYACNRLKPLSRTSSSQAGLVTGSAQLILANGGSANGSAWLSQLSQHYCQWYVFHIVFFHSSYGHPSMLVVVLFFPDFRAFSTAGSVMYWFRAEFSGSFRNCASGIMVSVEVISSVRSPSGILMTSLCKLSW